MASAPTSAASLDLSQLIPRLQPERETWVVVVPSERGRVQRFVCQTEGHARRFVALFERVLRLRARGVPQRPRAAAIDF